MGIMLKIARKETSVSTSAGLIEAIEVVAFHVLIEYQTEGRSKLKLYSTENMGGATVMPGETRSAAASGEQIVTMNCPSSHTFRSPYKIIEAVLASGIRGASWFWIIIRVGRGKAWDCTFIRSKSLKPVRRYSGRGDWSGGLTSSAKRHVEHSQGVNPSIQRRA